MGLGALEKLRISAWKPLFKLLIGYNRRGLFVFLQNVDHLNLKNWGVFPLLTALSEILVK